MNNILKYLLAFFGSFFSINCFAVDYTDLVAYEMEVIIFKFNDSRSAGNEVWPDLVETESTDNSIELHNSTSYTQVPGLDTKAYFYSKIPQENFRLITEAKKLVASKKFEILYHSAWIQPGLDKERAESIHIKTTEADLIAPVLDTLTPSVINNSNDNYHTIINTENSSKDNTILEGSIKVELGRYLHINFDLKYKRDLAPTQGVINTSSLNSYKDIKYYPVKMHRRMRSKEVHYIDHPLIGILVLATRFELPEDETAPELIEAPLRKLGNIPLSR